MVSTVGRDETVIHEYIRNREQEDKRPDQLNLWKRPTTVKVVQRNRGRVSEAHIVRPPALPGDTYFPELGTCSLNR